MFFIRVVSRFEFDKKVFSSTVLNFRDTVLSNKPKGRVPRALPVVLYGVLNRLTIGWDEYITVSRLKRDDCQLIRVDMGNPG